MTPSWYLGWWECASIVGNLGAAREPYGVSEESLERFSPTREWHVSHVTSLIGWLGVGRIRSGPEYVDGTKSPQVVAEAQNGTGRTLPNEKPRRESRSRTPRPIPAPPNADESHFPPRTSNPSSMKPPLQDFGPVTGAPRDGSPAHEPAVQSSVTIITTIVLPANVGPSRQTDTIKRSPPEDFRPAFSPHVTSPPTYESGYGA